jgi:hypothetical protein
LTLTTPDIDVMDAACAAELASIAATATMQFIRFI